MIVLRPEPAECCGSMRVNLIMIVSMMTIDTPGIQRKYHEQTMGNLIMITFYLSNKTRKATKFKSSVQHVGFPIEQPLCI